MLSSKSAFGMCSAVADNVRDTCSKYTWAKSFDRGFFVTASAIALAKRACANTARTSDTLKYPNDNVLDDASLLWNAAKSSAFSVPSAASRARHAARSFSMSVCVG